MAKRERELTTHELVHRAVEAGRLKREREEAERRESAAKKPGKDWATASAEEFDAEMRRIGVQVPCGIPRPKHKAAQ